MRLVTQPEMAYLRHRRSTIEIGEPPEGHLFCPHQQELDEDATQEHVFALMRELLIQLPEREDDGSG